MYVFMEKGERRESTKNVNKLFVVNINYMFTCAISSGFLKKKSTLELNSTVLGLIRIPEF